MEAETAYNQGNFDKALGLYQELSEQDPDDASLHWRLGTVYFSKGNKAKVRKEIKELRRLDHAELASDLEQLLGKQD